MNRLFSSSFRLALLLCCLLLTGCAALTNPVADGVRARRLPPELVEPPKDPEEAVPLSLLGQPPPDPYRLAPGDVLGVWIESVLGDRNVPPPIHVAPQVMPRDQRKLTPALGYPVPVEDDGTVHLPLVDPIAVHHLSLAEAREAIRKVYMAKQLLPAGRERVHVTLMQPRQYQVVVLRQEAGGPNPGAEPLLGPVKRGNGHVIDLPAYENDVLHALAQTGGLPGLDAYNEVVICRGFWKCGHDRAGLFRQIEAALRPGARAAVPDIPGQIIRIPLRCRPDEPPAIRPEDVVLHSGDVVYLEARDRGVFFTGGLLPAGEHPLPRDHDLDVVEAISRVRGPLVNGAFATNNLAGNLIAPGVGGPSPSLLVVLRKRPGGGRLPIRVDLNRAFRDPRECLRVQPGDVLILQEKPSEALARYFNQTFFNFSLAWQVVHERFATGVIDVSATERIPARIGVTDFINGR